MSNLVSPILSEEIPNRTQGNSGLLTSWERKSKKRRKKGNISIFSWIPFDSSSSRPLLNVVFFSACVTWTQKLLQTEEKWERENKWNFKFRRRRRVEKSKKVSNYKSEKFIDFYCWKVLVEELITDAFQAVEVLGIFFKKIFFIFFLDFFFKI